MWAVGLRVRSEARKAVHVANARDAKDLATTMAILVDKASC